MNKLPFKEIIADNLFIREFSKDTDYVEFMWHRVREDKKTCVRNEVS